MVRKVAFTILIIFSLSADLSGQDQPSVQPVPAQEPPLQDPGQVVRPVETAHTPSTIRRILTNFAHDQKGIWTSPFHIDRENAKWWALFGGGTAAPIGHPTFRLGARWGGSLVDTFSSSTSIRIFTSAILFSQAEDFATHPTRQPQLWVFRFVESMTR